MRERLDEHVEVGVREPRERARQLVDDVDERPGTRIEEPVLVARDVARQPVERRPQGAPQIGVELRLGDAGLLEVEEVEEVVAQRRPHGIGGLRRAGSGPARSPAKWMLSAAMARKRSGRRSAAVPRHRAAPVVAHDDRGVDAARVEQADDVADEMELGVLVDPGAGMSVVP